MTDTDLVEIFCILDKFCKYFGNNIGVDSRILTAPPSATKVARPPNFGGQFS